MTLTQIHYFLTAAEYLNISKAAEKLYVSQQVISKQIRLLEEDLNLQLFERKKQRIYLTKGGRLLYDLCIRHEEEFNYTLKEASLLNQGKHTIRLGVLDIPNLIDLVLPKISLLNERFPNISWEYYLGDFATIEHAMNISSIDLAVTLSTELPEKHPPEQTALLDTIQLGIVVGPQNELFKKDTLHITDLKSETFYLFDKHFSIDATNKVLTDCKIHGFLPKDIVYFSNLNSMAFALMTGKGITIGYDIFFRFNSSQLKFFPLEPNPNIQNANLIVAWRQPSLEPYAQFFIEV